MRKVIWRKVLRKDHYTSAPDYVLMGVAGIIVLFGLFALASASSVYSLNKFGSPYYVVLHQIYTGIIPGIFAFYFFSHFDYRKLEKFGYIFLAVSIMLLLLVFIPGLAAGYGKTRSWINIFGFSFQPAEAVKLTFLLFLASWMQKRGFSTIASFTYGFLPFLFYMGIIAYLIIQQPDLGTLIIIIFTSIVVYFIAGARKQHLLYIGILGIAGVITKVVKTPYLLNRIHVFLNPESDIENIGYQVYQSLIAIGSGGFFGLGFGKSQQKFLYLPEVSSDSIFPIIAEEMGFLVSSLLIFLFLVFLYRGIKITFQAQDPFGRFLAVGIVSWITFQTFLNIAVMVGLAPVTGIPFPFISAGGTSMVVNVSALGILVNISKHRL